ncbi:quinolinate synthase NadA [Leptospira santarosai]|uniref:Quinolinate synthase n=2 Tax=Leptospira santarosai TaxID=28183 RepID=M6V9W7_9LEPT|nr:quinolinate synthase NadA [Leptospira santarosai]EKS10340.1 quinolinate synthetase complex, A subunit [Leptospira santarosai str. JET]EKT86615.1 quinolinate synthetase [Leptospira santarosai serovar Shermani str. LT 821]EMO46313.1 quinolinate synthetase complex, A subunit [Leptospira santarosai str. ZUN179]EPG81760.1 quinolinate synthetase complex, A subunit [Leptospira santarosai serovar Shermani str. 1342KT]MDI7196681.1 quinolinate synthase NadA [Leptospira santarosai]
MKTLEEVTTALKNTYMEHEVEEKLPLIQEIQKLKKEKNAILLGHNYMTPDVFHGVSDITGDSLYLSKVAADTEADIILFNGVHFMAETAKLMSPQKKVLIADLKAGCSLAESITRQDVIDLKQKYPGVPVVTYVNCTADVKAETDICCTSANALQVVESLESDTVIFLPDRYLAANVQNLTKKKIITHPGSCMVHEMYSAEDIELTRRQFPGVTVISHPECKTEVVDRSDYSGSTSQMSDFIRKSGAKNIFLITECSMGDNLRSEFPDRHFVSTCQVCPHMKRITLEKIRDSLLFDRYEIHLDPEVIEKGRMSVQRMLDLSFKK